MNKDVYEIKELMLNDDGSYYIVVNARTPEGLNVRIDIPSATIEDISPFEDLIVDNIIKLPQIPTECILQCEVDNE